MRILFVHQNFPGQFKHLAPALAANLNNEVVAFTMNENPCDPPIRVIRYYAVRKSSETIHPWVSDLETKVIRGDVAYRAALELRKTGFIPDVIVAHPGWGESLFLKEVWPSAKLGIYSEFYYHPSGADVGFDPEFPPNDVGDVCRLRLKNANNLLHFDIADAGISPTHWQKSTFPEPFRSKITVIHDGIDTDVIVPNANVSLTLNGKLHLTRNDEIITFVNRNLEPYRGYHTFMRSLPGILAARPKLRVLIVGGDDVSYGARPTAGKKWKEIFFDEVKDQIDRSRVHFLGRIPYNHFISLLQLSTVHVYLTYPFVLSWSLLEAMSAACAIVASNTKPLHEAIVHDYTGRLVDFFSPTELRDEVVRLLEQPLERTRLGNGARILARQHFDLKTVCLPKQIEWVYGLSEAFTDAKNDKRQSEIMIQRNEQ